MALPANVVLGIGATTVPKEFLISFSFHYMSGSLTKRVSVVAQVVKNMPAMKETQVRSWIGKIPLEKGITTQSSILAWKIPGQRILAGYDSWGHKEFASTMK